VRDIGLHQRQPEGARRHLESHIGAIVQGAGSLGHGGRAGILAAPDATVGRHLEGQFLDIHFAAQHLGGVHDGIDQGLVAVAAADVVVPGEPGADLFAGGRWILIQERLGRDDKSGDADAALGGAVGYKGHLDGMQVIRCADALDSGDLGVVGNPCHLGHTRQGELAIDDDVAGTTVPVTTTNLGPHEPQLLADHVRQLGLWIHD